MQLLTGREIEHTRFSIGLNHPHNIRVKEKWAVLETAILAMVILVIVLTAFMMGRLFEATKGASPSAWSQYESSMVKGH
jgi:hypothetical protein